MEKLHHDGTMSSMVDDCQFVCIRQSDYYRILHQGEENTQRVEEDGKLVLVMEQRHIEAINRKGNIVIKVSSHRVIFIFKCVGHFSIKTLTFLCHNIQYYLLRINIASRKKKLSY